MRAGHYFRLLARNRFRIGFMGIGMSFMIIWFSMANSLAWRLQQLLFGQKIERAKLKEPPIFIIGHWRSGTTLLHEYLVKDRRFAYPTTFQVFAPTHFLLTDWILPRLLWFIIPSKRPMDNMATGFERPQEDEFSLCAMGAPTPYERMAFPNNPPVYLEFLNMKNCKAEDQSAFEAALQWFVKAVSYKSGGRRLILKSPPHTGRIETLRRLFPNAKFIHICRDPLEVYSSTMRLWPALDRAQGFQMPKYSDEWLESYVFDCGRRMYEGYLEQSQLLPPEDLMEVRYEDLVEDPLETLKAIYEACDLGDFSETQESMEAFIRTQKSYQPNKHRLDGAKAQRVYQEWRVYFDRFGYAPPQSDSISATASSGN